MAGHVLLREDELDLAHLVTELLGEAGYTVSVVVEIEELLTQAALRSPCIALIDGSGAAAFDLWWLGPRLTSMGVPPVAFTAHAAARVAFEADPHDFVGIVTKPFDVDEFVKLVDFICHEGAGSAVS